MEKVLSFLNQIKDNNSKAWLDAHKAEYLEAQQVFLTFVEKLIAGIGAFDESVKDSLYE